MSIQIRKGAYDKGLLWKWGARMQGGGLVILVLGLLVGSFGAGFLMFLFATAIAAALTYRVGLKPDPTQESYTTPPGDSWMGLGFILQDKLGDLVLTPIWNVIRNSTDYRV